MPEERICAELVAGGQHSGAAVRQHPVSANSAEIELEYHHGNRQDFGEQTDQTAHGFYAGA